MSTQTRHYEGDNREWYQRDDPTGYGWLLFAGTVLLLLATMNGIDGIAAVSNSRFYAHGTYVIGDLNTWGWVLIGVSVIQLLAGFGIFIQSSLARWVGVGIAAVNGVVQLLFIQAYPFWSLTLFGLDILVIWALVVHGGLFRQES